MMTIELTPALWAAIEKCRRSRRGYLPGQMSASVVELPALELAAVFLETFAQQRAAAHVERLLRLPTARPAPIAVRDLPRRRRRRRA